MVQLKTIQDDNFEDIIQLKVRDDQPYVAPNVYSIAQAKIYPECTIRAIYVDDTPVGFLMFGWSDEDPPYIGPWLIRFMIDAKHQQKGYGKEALRLTLDLMERVYPNEPLYLSTAPENVPAIKFYESFGFVSTGVILHDELVFYKDVKNVFKRK